MAVNEIPNFTGVMAIPRLIRDDLALNASIAARRSWSRDERTNVDQICGIRLVLELLPVMRCSSRLFRDRIPFPHAFGYNSNRRAMRSRISSMTSIPCGPPKPRNAVCETTFVFATRP